MIRIAFTYEVTTHESAAEGDFSDHGFYEPGGWEYSLNNPHTAKDIQDNPDDYRKPWEPGDLKKAIEDARDLGITCSGGSVEYIDEIDWFSSVDPLCDRAYFEQGESRFFSLHVDGCTASTKKRIYRLLQK